MLQNRASIGAYHVVQALYSLWICSSKIAGMLWVTQLASRLHGAVDLRPER